MNKNEFVTKFNDKEVTLNTVTLNSRIRREADKYANQAFQEAISNKFILNVQVEQILRDSGYDFDKEEKQFADLQKQIQDAEKQLLSGRKDGYKLTKKEGRKLALEIRRLRNELLNVSSARQSLYNRTAEKQADNERMQYFVYACTIDPSNGKPFFRTFEESKENADSDLVLDATRNFLKTVLGFDNEAEKQLPENKWLIKYGFANDKLQLINKNGQLVDEEFRLIDENGRFINDKGEFVDINGNRVDENGNMILSDDDIYTD